MEATVLRALSDTLADTGFSGRAWSTLELVQQLTTWLAQMSEDQETAMQQATAARIIEPRPAAPAAVTAAYEGAMRDPASVAAYQTLDHRSSNTKMLLLALALFAVLGRLALPVLVRGVRRVCVAIYAAVARIHAGWACLARALHAAPASIAAFASVVFLVPRLRLRYAAARC
jgi:hypothetical protein